MANDVKHKTVTRNNVQSFLDKIEKRKKSILVATDLLIETLFRELFHDQFSFDDQPLSSTDNHPQYNYLKQQQESQQSKGEKQHKKCLEHIKMVIDDEVTLFIYKFRKILIQSLNTVTRDYERCINNTNNNINDDITDDFELGNIFDPEYDPVRLLEKVTKVKARKRTKKQSADDRALKLRNETPPKKFKPFYCKWPRCDYASAVKHNVSRHISHKHYHLPVTKMEMQELGLNDCRDPFKFVGQLLSENEKRQTINPTEEDSFQPIYYQTRKHVCTFTDCGATFRKKSCLLVHERSHTGLRPYRCTFKGCTFYSQLRNLVRQHIRRKHFKLPKSLKEQECNRIIDTRDPDQFIEEDTETRLMFNIN